jgi:hypothetical protein
VTFVLFVVEEGALFVDNFFVTLSKLAPFDLSKVSKPVLSLSKGANGYTTPVHASIPFGTSGLASARTLVVVPNWVLR